MVLDNVSIEESPIIKEMPSLRFKEFKDNLHISKLEDISKVTGGKRIPKGYSLVDEKNEHPYITVSDMNRGLDDLSNFQYVPLDAFPMIQRYIVDEDDLIISVAGTLGVIKKVPSVLDKANLTENANRIFDIKINKDFLFYYLNSNSIQRRILSVQTNNAQPKLALREVRSFKIKYPSLEEQDKIANFLSSTDKKIELLEKKYSGYQNFKKYLMQQIFTRELKFNPDEDWKQFKLKDLFEVKSSGISINKVDDNVGEYPLYGTSGYLKSIDFYEMDQEYLSITKDGSVGKIDYHEGNSSVINTSQYLIPKNEYDIHFLYYQMQTLNFQKYIVGSSIPHIYFKDYGNENVLIPTLDEQIKIGKLFKSVDDNLENINNSILSYKEFKKGLLQKMFV